MRLNRCLLSAKLVTINTMSMGGPVKSHHGNITGGVTGLMLLLKSGVWVDVRVSLGFGLLYLGFVSIGLKGLGFS